MITGDSSSNKLDGRGGDDTINGGAGNDLIIGGAGEDTLDGGAGEDDTLSYENDTAGVTVSLAASTASGGNAAGDTIKGFENITGGEGGDTLTGDNKANELTGGEGVDILIGNPGRDTLTGGAGNDCFIVDARGTMAGDYETITDFNKVEDAITACGEEAAVGDDEGETLLKFSGSRIERLTRPSVAEDPNTDGIQRVTAKYLHVATLSSNSTRLTDEEIEGLDATDTTIGNSNVTCTCPTLN